MSKGLKQSLTIFITFIAMLVLAVVSLYVYLAWFTTECSVLYTGEEADIVHGDQVVSYMTPLLQSDIDAACKILSDNNIKYEIPATKYAVQVRYIDEKRASAALLNSNYEFDGQVFTPSCD